MKKETIIAIILGIVAGISIAAVVIIQSRNSSGSNGDVILEGVSPTTIIDRNETSPLLIAEPDTEAVVETSTITLKGSGPENALIVIHTPSQEYVFKNTKTNFSQKLALMPGENAIRVTSYDKKNVDSRTLTIYSIPQTK
jgi:hypothetical protein